MTREQEILNDLNGLVGQVTKINATLEASLAEGVDLQRLGRLLGEHEAVTAALWDYHHALDTRQDGNSAGYKLIAAVEAALGKPWERGATLKEPTARISDGANVE